nr:NADH dehydrogenase subunit 6 [Stenochironomus sp. 2CZ]
MMQKIFFLLILIFSFLFIFLNHPLTMNTNLMLQAFLITIFSGLLIKSFWFSYSLFLIFLGGMLILFMYMTMVASNEKFSFKMNKNKSTFSILFFMLIFLMFFFLFSMHYSMFKNMIFNMENMKFKQNMIFFKNDNLFMLNKLYNFPMNLLSMILMLYLLLTLIASVKISNSNNLSMRI